MPLTAHEACRVAGDWTQSLLPRPPQPVQPSSGHSIRDSWPFSICLFVCFGWDEGRGRKRLHKVRGIRGREKKVEFFFCASQP